LSNPADRAIITLWAGRDLPHAIRHHVDPPRDDLVAQFAETFFDVREERREFVRLGGVGTVAESDTAVFLDGCLYTSDRTPGAIVPSIDSR